jgi:AcrR family transcriptional regulator
MVRKTREEAEATRDAILDAASIVFVKHGIANASLENIAAAAGVTRGAIYWHFKNKTDIVLAMYDRLYTSFSDTLLENLQNDHPCPLQQLRELMTELLLDLERNALKRRTLTLFFLKCDYSGDLEKLLVSKNQRRVEHVRLFGEYFARAKQKNHLPPEADTCILALSFTCYVTGMAYEYLRNPDLFNLEQQAPALVSQFFAGLHCRLPSAAVQ